MKISLRAGAFALLAANLAAPPRARAALPFVEDNYSRAVADARARNVPIFLEAWAPW